MCASPLFAQFGQKKSYAINYYNNPPKIDGKLDDIAWQKLDKTSDFVEMIPNNGALQKQAQATEVQICYDDNAIYFGVMMHDNAPDSILKELSRRDVQNENFDNLDL